MHSRALRFGASAPQRRCVAIPRRTARPRLNAVSRSEEVIQSFESELQSSERAAVALPQEPLAGCDARIQELSADIDRLYSKYFCMEDLELEDGSTRSFADMTEADVQLLGRAEPRVSQQLLEALRKRDSATWTAFQQQVQSLKLKRAEVQKRAESLRSLAAEAAAVPAYALESESEDEGAAEGARLRLSKSGRTAPIRVVLITGFESFNQLLYRKAAQQARKRFPGLELSVFSDRDISTKREEIEAALSSADVFFASLLFDYDQVEWLRRHVDRVPVRLVFESALELMSTTKVGSFEMAAPSGKKAGPPPAVKKILGLFGSQKEEDRLSGYLSFLKIGPKILKYFPMKKAQDLRAWLTVYGYWNEGGIENVVNMFLYICNTFFADTGLQPAEVTVTPPTGCLHPKYQGYFNSPAEYMTWYAKHGPTQAADAPRVGILLYRKHVITKQMYIGQLIEQMEAEGIVPVPIFINGVEAHTIVRDQLTTRHEQGLVAAGKGPQGLKPDAVEVDAFVSTIGFPLVGGPAGTMEGSRQAEVAKEILESKNVPYFVAAPLLIQDLASWVRDGIAGLQSVVLYSLPELDGAIDTVPLGGLVGNNIFLIPERVKRLAQRIRTWSTLRRKAEQERKIAVLLYGFPPGVGATGTAALLNVPASLEHMLVTLREQGYDLGDVPEDLSGLGEAIVTALKRQESTSVVARGAAGIERAGIGAAADYGAQPSATEVPMKWLRERLTFDESWGPTEWGPIPFLPRATMLTDNMEAAWGDLYKYRGLNTTAKGDMLVNGVQLGNLWIGVQPLLGIEGDPMRLLFDRDLTPHPQYAAFYKWLEHDLRADAVVHFGMHGTVEWLPGQPLGNSGFSWSDVLLSNMPNVYVYAANNPSESIIAKRRGYGTIVSHNVPPYGRAGLYKQLAELQALLSEYREDPAGNDTLRDAIVDCLNKTGLEKDCPFLGDNDAEMRLTVDNVAEVPQGAFENYCNTLYRYLQEVENRLFSEGLHQFGQEPDAGQLQQYLTAYMDGRLQDDAIEAIAKAPVSDLDVVRQSLERRYAAPAASTSAGAADSSSNGHELAALDEAVEIRRLLSQNTEEMASLVRALNGEYVLPQAGGDLLRDGPGVLPTGRNIHALDPYRMPSQAAEGRGYAAAEAVVEQHRANNDGSYPETIAVNLWGLDAIKTKGESVAMALWLVGARPVKEGTGRIARFELIPLKELGRPRIDVLCNMSGIFRDSFQNVVELLDDMFQRAADADEPPEGNYVRKHALALKAENASVENPGARLFCNPPGDYGSMVNERVGASDWTDGAELGETWASRNAFSYGRGTERGTARPDVLQSLLESTDRVVQQVDSVEYGLTDIQEYYANTGALKAAAESARGRKGRSGDVGCSIVECFSSDAKPRELEEVLRLEYRSKLLNPKWAKAMASQGSGGAYEISQRMTAMLGWGATTEFAEDWTWNQAAETYVLDEEMAETLRKNNPEAFKNSVRRMLEASGRGLWKADEAVLEKLQNAYADLDEELEKGQITR